MRGTTPEAAVKCMTCVTTRKSRQIFCPPCNLPAIASFHLTIIPWLLPSSTASAKKRLRENLCISICSSRSTVLCFVNSFETTWNLLAFFIASFLFYFVASFNVAMNHLIILTNMTNECAKGSFRYESITGYEGMQTYGLRPSSLQACNLYTWIVAAAYDCH